MKQLPLTHAYFIPKRKKLDFKKWKRNKKISAFDIAIFFRQLATLISSGIPMVQSLEILRQSQEKLSLKKLILTLKQQIESGKSLMNGFHHFPDYFDELTCHLVNAGEQTGTLDKMLKRIAYYKEKSLTLKTRIKQALFYPGIIFAVAIVVSIIMLAFVVPRFAELFESMHGHLPGFTQFVISLSGFFRQYILFIIFTIAALFFFIYYLLSSAKYKTHIDQFILKIPIVGNVIQKAILARFTRSLAITYSAGVPIISALNIVANISGNNVYSQAITKLQTNIAMGQQLHHAMQTNSLFPIMTIQMVKIGEESGTLEPMLDKIAELYEADIDHLIANLSHMLEPLIMIILGVLIGGLVIAMYLPIFKLGNVI